MLDTLSCMSYCGSLMHYSHYFALTWGRGLLAARMLFTLLMVVGTLASAASLTLSEEEKMSGKWIVNGGGKERVYEITPGRNVRIEGSGLKDRRGRLTPQPDGTYVIKLEDDTHLKLTYAPASDDLTVEYYKGKKDLELGLKPMWKVQAARKRD